MAIQNLYFNGNKKLRNAGIKIDYTEDQINEIIKCVDSVHYFCNEFVYIVNVDKGLVKFKLYDYQNDLLDQFNDHLRSVVLAPRQCGKTTTTCAFLLHYAMFNDHKQVAILANKGRTARAVLKKIRTMYEYLPFWLKQGVVEYNKGSIIFENGSSIIADSTTAGSIRGDSLALLYIDECAFIPSTLFNDFYTSTYPTISSSRTAKILISSTPNGLNHFYKIYKLAEEGKSEFKTFKINWNDVPGRDEEFKRKTIAELGGAGEGERKWNQEYNCDFLGSSGTLIDAKKLTSMVWKDPIEKRYDDKFLIYEKPEKNAIYIAFVDVSEGVKGDSSTVQVFKQTTYNWKQVARFKDDTIRTHEFPTVIEKIGKYYNNALVIVESNTYGREILNKLHFDLEYENLFYDKDFGLKMTRQSKSIGNTYLKDYIENDKFDVCDFDTISEMSKYIKKGESYSAEDGEHDDLVTPMVIGSFFLSRKEYVDKWITNAPKPTEAETQKFKKIEDELLPMGFLNDGYKTTNIDPSSRKFVQEYED